MASFATHFRRKPRVINLRHDGFNPFPTQRKFCLSDARTRWYVGGMGAGKTQILGFECLRLAIANAGHEGFICAPTFQMLVRVTLPAFLKLVPKDLVEDHHKSHRCIELINGSKIWYGSASDEEAAAALEGSNLAWAAMDECRYLPEAAHVNLRGRIRVRCPRPALIGVSTPDLGGGWLEAAVNAGYNTELFTAPTTENLALPEEYAKDLRAQYSADDVARLVDGRFTKSSGQVFRDWDDEKNVVDYSYLPGNGTLRVALDFGYNMPSALWFVNLPDPQNSGENIDVLIDELHPEEVTADQFAEMIIRRNTERGYVVEEYFGDPAGNNKNSAGTSDIADFANRGIGVTFSTNPAYRSIKTGLTIMRGRICSADGQRKAFITREMMDTYANNRGVKRCFAKDVSNYRYPPKDKPGIRADIPDPKLNLTTEHSMDAARYYFTHMYPHLGMRSSNFTTVDNVPKAEPGTIYRSTYERRDSAWRSIGGEDAFSNEMMREY